MEGFASFGLVRSTKLAAEIVGNSLSKPLISTTAAESVADGERDGTLKICDAIGVDTSNKDWCLSIRTISKSNEGAPHRHHTVRCNFSQVTISSERSVRL